MEDPVITVCYRHGDRPTALACSHCGRPICADCSTEAPVGQRCPECLREEGRQTVIHGRRIRSRPTFQQAPVTFLLIGVAAAFFLMSFVQRALWNDLFDRLAMWNLGVAEGEWWRMFTLVFLHAGLIHVGFNSLLLYQLGVQLERQTGSTRYLILFFATAATGSVLAFHLGDPGDVGIGMSGAVFGVVGVWLASGFRHRRTAQGRMILDQLTGLIVLNAIVPFVIPNVSWQGHLGGLVGGFAIGQMWSAIGRLGSSLRWLQPVSGLLVAALAVFSTQL